VSDQTLEMNLRFIKPSHNFYNHVMSQWFKFLNLIEEQLVEQKELNPTSQQITWNHLELVKSFLGFYKSTCPIS